uniref:MFS transporter n=1 Tax=Thermosporothrix sp. COM3 TaxID=2490863 RepID=A0A455SGN7_9CHLR|nr:MFS transporter [Thermosporothrix sp. COM3]
MNGPSSEQGEPPGSDNLRLLGLSRIFSSLKQRNFRLFWFGQLISLIGTSMQAIGQDWLVLKLTHSAWQLGLVGALQAAPVLFFSIIGGVLADRLPRRQLLLITQWINMLEALLLWALIATGQVQLWHLYILAPLLGLTGTIYRPASRAFLVELVGRDDLPNAIALYSSISTLARIVGPGLGGVIIAISSETQLFLLNALSFLPVIAGLLLMRSHELAIQPTTGKRASARQSLREGIDYCLRTPAVLQIIVVVGLVLLFGSNFGVILPVFATDVLHAGPTGFGFLSAAASGGALLAALWLAWKNQQPTVRLLLLYMLLFGLLEVVFSLSPIYFLAILLLASIGFLENAFAAQAMTTLQQITPDHLLGRVISVQVLFFDGSLPLGYMLIGWLSSLYGPSIALLVGALLTLLTVGAGWLWHSLPRRSEGSSS